MNQSEIIGNRVKEERLKRKLTLKQLSEQVGLSIGYLSQVERGYGTLSLNALKNLSSVLGIEMSAFFDLRKKTPVISLTDIRGNSFRFPANSFSIRLPLLLPILQ